MDAVQSLIAAKGGFACVLLVIWVQHPTAVFCIIIIIFFMYTSAQCLVNNAQVLGLFWYVGLASRNNCVSRTMSHGLKLDWDIHAVMMRGWTADMSRPAGVMPRRELFYGLGAGSPILLYCGSGGRLKIPVLLACINTCVRRVGGWNVAALFFFLVAALFSNSLVTGNVS